MSQYQSEYPDLAVDAAVKAFFEQFYRISDTPDAHELYAQQFTADATLVMASNKVHGTEAILGLRKGMWAKVSSRAHKPVKMFPFGANADEIMLHGTVDYVLKDGKQASVEWAARAHLVTRDSAVKMDYYQVYLDTAAQNAAK